MGTPHAVGLLALAAVAVAVAGALAILLLELGTRGRPLGNAEAVWESLIRTLDPGQLALDDVAGASGAARRWGFAIVALFITLAGLLLVSSLVSIINNNVERAIERADLGRARSSTTRTKPGPRYVLLGWSELVPRILEELARSTDGDPPAVLVMADMELRQMEQRIRELRVELLDPTSAGVAPLDLTKRWPELRTGSGVDRRDLIQLASVHTADAVIVLAPDPSPSSAPDDVPEHGLDSSSAHVIRTLFATASVVEARRSDNGGTTRIVVELPESSRGTADLARRISERFSSPAGTRHALDVVAVDSRLVQSRLAAQVVRRPGLSEVYEDLLTFAGAEIRVLENPGYRTFWDAVHGPSHHSVIGLVAPDGSANLWPEWDADATRCRLVAVADNGAAPERREVSVGPPGERPESTVSTKGSRAEKQGEGVLVIGWNSRGPELVEALDSYLSPVAPITVVTEISEPKIPVSRTFGTGDAATINCLVVDDLQAWLDDPDSVRDVPHSIVLGDDRMSAEVSDAHVLLALEALHPPGQPANPGTVVAELRLRSSRHLPSHHEHCDLIVGDALVALLVAHFAVDSDSRSVLGALTDGGGIEFDLSATEEPDEILTFDAAVQHFAEHGQVAVGYRVRSPEGHHPALVLNPAKDTDLSDMEVVDFVVLARRRGASPRTGRPSASA
jgi:hypothetical protein